MSDFLSRLVQRTRGEAATVRPVGPAVTAPDLGAAAWDEQVIVREAPLAVSLRAPIALPAPPVIQRATAGPPVLARAAAESVPAAMGIPGEVARADESAVERNEPVSAAPQGPASPPPVPATPGPPLAAAAIVRTSSSHQERGQQPQLAEAGTEGPAGRIAITAPAPEPGDPFSLVDVRELHVPATPPPAGSLQLLAAPAARSPAALAPARAADARTIDVAVDAPTPSPAHTAVTLARPAPSPPVTALRDALSAAPARTATAHAEAARLHQAAADATAARARPAAADAGAAPAHPAVTDGVSVRLLPPLARAEPRRNVAPLSPGRTPLRDDVAPVHEYSTTVEVSIGRIEVRLPPQPRPAAAAEPLPAPRHAAVSLADYLRGRDAGKTR